MNKKLLKPYDPSQTEARIYKEWEESGLFNPDICIQKGTTAASAETFSMVLPPPNVTGVLHMGHALMISIQDTLTRFERMRGKRTLWIPGTDHAAIATQAKVEKILEKEESLRKTDLSRVIFLERVTNFAEQSHQTIANQMRVMGASVDWSREAFTLDAIRSRGVREAFVRMYNDGLIYRGYKVVNWDPKGQTTVSDDEVEHEERQATLYTFRYAPDFPIPIATTRLETKVGDTAVAVHPNDPRYKKFIGQEYDVVFCGVPLHLKIISDESVEPEFGTGALGVTPAHSQTDFEMAERHNLPIIPVINEFAKMSVSEPTLNGLKIVAAREHIIVWLKENNLLEKEEAITQNVSVSERTGAIIEPLPKLQWFVNVNKEFVLAESKIKGISSGSKTTLKEIMRHAVQNEQISILPDNFSKVYFHWINNLRDWCISRQIWYGHRIPVWYRGDEVYCGLEAPVESGLMSQNASGDVDWVQDEDTLDTWFSSGLWTFSTLGWPDNTADLRDYHPTTLVQPGYEIIFFWVARMILMSGYLLGDIPFRTVYFNGIVRDAQGRKLSKSLGNGRDPIEVAQEYGADAIRMFFASTTTPGMDSRIQEDKIKGYKHFANKLWNITRFITTAVEAQNLNLITLSEHAEILPVDAALISELQELHADITSELEAYHLHLAADKIYQYVWKRLADVLIEESKSILAAADAAAASRAKTLFILLEGVLKMTHPFMPFVTEEIWSMLPERKSFLMVSSWKI